MNFYIFITGEKGGGALVHVYVWEHRVSRLIFTKLGRDKVLMTPNICIEFWAKSARGGSRGGP